MPRSSAAESDLIKRWIELHPHKTEPAEALVRPRLVSVWAVAGQLELEHGAVEVVAEVYDLPPEAIEAAKAYYHRHKPDIDARLARNRAALRT